jgi:hypothetical protein
MPTETQDTLRITCTCGYKGRVKASLGGRAVRCKKCRAKIRVPGRAGPRTFEPKSAKRGRGEPGLADQEFALHSNKALLVAGLLALLVTIVAWGSAMNSMPLMDRSFAVGLVLAIALTPLGPALLLGLRSKVVVTETGLREITFLRTRELSFDTLALKDLEFVDQALIVHAERTNSAWGEPLSMHGWTCQWFIPFYEALATYKYRAGEPIPRHLLMQFVDQMSEHLEERPGGLDLLTVVRGPTSILVNVLAQAAIDRREKELVAFLENELGSLD